MVCSTIGFFYANHVAEKLNVPYVPAFLQPLNPTRYIPCMPFPEPPELLVKSQRLTGRYNLLTYWMAEKMLFLVRRGYEPGPASGARAATDKRGESFQKNGKRAASLHVCV